MGKNAYMGIYGERLPYAMGHGKNLPRLFPKDTILRDMGERMGKNMVECKLVKKPKSKLPATSHANDFWMDECLCNRLLDGLREGRDLKATCEAVGVPKADYDRALKEGYRCLLRAPKDRTPDEMARAEFYCKAKEAVSEFEKSCVTTVLKSAKMGDWKAAAWLLERRLPEVYGKRELPPLQPQTDAKPQAIQIKIVDAGADAERMKRLEREVDMETDGVPAIDAEADGK